METVALPVTALWQLIEDPDSWDTGYRKVSVGDWHTNDRGVLMRDLIFRDREERYYRWRQVADCQDFPDEGGGFRYVDRVFANQVNGATKWLNDDELCELMDSMIAEQQAELCDTFLGTE